MENTREKVIIAAKEIFVSKGFEGARMQEIADHAGINKGLLHYYFKSKENLFRAVVKEVIATIVPKIDIMINMDLELKEKIRQFVEIYMDMLIQNPYLPPFIMAELNLRQEAFVREILKGANLNPMKLIMQVQMEVQKGKIRNIDPFTLLLNVLSMCVFPFIGRPIIKEITGFNDSQYLEMMEHRKKEIVDFTLNALIIQ